MITLFSFLTTALSLTAEETREEFEARSLAEMKAYVASLSDEDFEAWIVNMEKLDRIIDIVKIMRLEWVIARMEAILDSSSLVRDRHALGKDRQSMDSHRIHYALTSTENKVPLAISYMRCCTGQPYSVFNFTITNDVCHIDEYSIAYLAYNYAKALDKESRDDTRALASLQQDFAYYYALDIDKGPHDITRKGACLQPETAYLYATNVDKCPRQDTREAAHHSDQIGVKYDDYFKI